MNPNKKKIFKKLKKKLWELEINLQRKQKIIQMLCNVYLCMYYILQKAMNGIIVK